MHEKMVMLSVDMQGDFETPPEQRPIAQEGGLEALKNMRILVDAVRKANMPIIFLQEVHRPDLVDIGRELDGDEDVHCIETDPKNALAPGLTPIEGRREYLVPKRRYDGFLGTDLQLVLNGLGIFPGDTILVGGGLSNVCVHYTCAGAHQRDYRLKVVEPCCLGSSKRMHDSAMEQIEYLQNGSVIPLEEALRLVAEYQSPYV